MLNLTQIVADFHAKSHYAFLADHQGEQLGKGIYRDVYALRNSNLYVLKVSNCPGDFSNVREWEIYDFLRNTTTCDLLAPCHAISDDSHFLLQSRTTPLGPKPNLPAKVPYWMSDFKLANWGKLKNKVVCHDYASCLVLNYCATGKAKKPNFYTP